MKVLTLSTLSLALVACNPSAASDSATEDASGTDASTGSSPTTGEPSSCAPDVPPLLESEFAQAFAERICEQKSACGCDAGPLCVDTFTAAFKDIQNEAALRSLPFDGDCAARMLEGLVTANACKTVTEDTSDAICWSCTIYQGAIPAGEACSSVAIEGSYHYIRECDETSACNSVTGLCQALATDTGEVGAACYSQDVGLITTCDPGLYCNFDSGKCAAYVPDGEPCEPNDRCIIFSSWCDDGVCQPLKATGSPCGSPLECTSYVCAEGLCADPVWICGVDGPAY